MSEKYIHIDTDNRFLTLHDCIAEKVYLQDGVLVFELNDGFWIGPEHPDNPYNECLRTDKARVEFVLENGEEYDAYAWLHVQENPKSRKKTVRNWEIAQLIKNVNSGKCAFEFWDEYHNPHVPVERLIGGELRGEGKLNFSQCWMRIYATKVNYCWNHVLPDRPW